MRKQLIECASEVEAYNRAPWASVMVKVEGGWMAFESINDMETWSKQV